MKSITTLFILTTVAILMSSCGNKENSEEQAAVNEHLVQISKEQFEAENMQLGDTKMHTFKKVFKTNGIVTASPQSKADVYSYLSGIIKSIQVNPGVFVRKGQLLLSIESKEFINLQRDYLEALAQFKATNADYKRVKELYDEKISSQKEYFSIESKYKMLQAKIQALKAELKIVNVNFSSLESGNISSYLNIYAPIKGYVSNLKCNTGEFINSDVLIMQIIDNSNLQLHFFVYQETVGNLQIGQKVNIYSPDNSGKTYSASINYIGKSIDKESKSIRCIAEPENHLKKIFVDGMYFQVEVITDSIIAPALPSEAIIKSGDAYYVLVKEKEDAENLYFKKKYLKTGINDKDYTQIIDNKNLNGVLVKGTYYYKK
ncbi:MAG: efflux RND transporter periplasmic adaptor subunit [Bacteroidales bacterium]|nr:efflux RND transporter periplasmic adaptor subunit [Bacteroidales bacterium]